MHGDGRRPVGPNCVIDGDELKPITNTSGLWEGSLVSAQSALNQTDPPSLCFSSVEGARDFAANSVQDSVDWLAGQDINFAIGYVEGKVQIVCPWCLNRVKGLPIPGANE